jgi:hypothetical protein
MHPLYIFAWRSIKSNKQIHVFSYDPEEAGSAANFTNEEAPCPTRFTLYPLALYPTRTSGLRLSRTTHSKRSAERSSPMAR